MDQVAIRPGEIFPWAIQQAAVHAQAMLVILGRNWLVPDSQGRRRIDNETDYVRREICAGLDRGTLVVPLLVPGAGIPDMYSLPEDLRRLSDVQFYELDHRRWRVEVSQLADYLKERVKFESREPDVSA
jgi:hypothetical protein